MRGGTVCGKCRGRGEVRELHGLETRQCDRCGGAGVRRQSSPLGSKTVSLGRPFGGCSFCDRPAVEFHHIVPQQRIERFVEVERRQEAKANPANGVKVCRNCHDRIERGSLQVPVEGLGPAFFRFVADYDLWAAMPLHLQTDDVYEQLRSLV